MGEKGYLRSLGLGGVVLADSWLMSVTHGVHLEDIGNVPPHMTNRE
jgi:hypothetical protein